MCGEESVSAVPGEWVFFINTISSENFGLTGANIEQQFNTTDPECGIHFFVSLEQTGEAVTETAPWKDFVSLSTDNSLQAVNLRQYI